MTVLKGIVIILNIIFCAVVMYFLRPLRWEHPEDRSSIIGFVMMIATFLLSALLLAL